MADKEEPKKKQSTIKQIIQIFKYTHAEDKALPWLCGGVFVAPIIVFVVLGIVFKWSVIGWITSMILAVMLGLLFATMMLTNRADKVGYAKLEAVRVPPSAFSATSTRLASTSRRNRCGLIRRPRMPSGAVPATTVFICWAKANTAVSSVP